MFIPVDSQDWPVDSIGGSVGMGVGVMNGVIVGEVVGEGAILQIHLFGSVMPPCG